MGNGDNVPCPFISESKIGLWPSPTTPQFNKSNMNPSMNCFTNFAKNEQITHHNIAIGSQGPKEMALTCRK